MRLHEGKRTPSFSSEQSNVLEGCRAVSASVQNFDGFPASQEHSKNAIVE